MISATFNVPGISCEHCKHAISLALLPVEGIKDVYVDIPGKQVHVSFGSPLTAFSMRAEFFS